VKLNGRIGVKKFLLFAKKMLAITFYTFLVISETGWWNLRINIRNETFFL